MELRPTTELLRECRSEAFHLEVRDTYGVPDEDEAFRAFVDDEPYDYRTWFHDRYTFVEDLTARGVFVSRVRVVTVPHSDYQRWSLVIAGLNASGETTLDGLDHLDRGYDRMAEKLAAVGADVVRSDGNG